MTAANAIGNLHIEKLCLEFSFPQVSQVVKWPFFSIITIPIFTLELMLGRVSDIWLLFVKVFMQSMNEGQAQLSFRG